MLVFPACCRAFSSLLLVLLLLLSSCSWLIGVVSAGCADDYNLDHHHVTGKLDICSIEEELPDEIQILINWGSRPEWIDGERFVFRSNSVGDVWLMDLTTNDGPFVDGALCALWLCPGAGVEERRPVVERAEQRPAAAGRSPGDLRRGPFQWRPVPSQGPRLRRSARAPECACLGRSGSVEDKQPHCLVGHHQAVFWQEHY